MMGFFAVFCGLIYNDFLSMPLNFFGSCFDFESGDKECTYIFGVDPYWGLSRNKLSYYNSLKMKLSVILGVTQMILGVFLKGSNAIYFKNKLDFICEFIP